MNNPRWPPGGGARAEATGRPPAIRGKVAALDAETRAVDPHLTSCLEEPKSKASRRSLDLPKVAMAALLEHRRRMLTEGHDIKAGPASFTKTGNLSKKVYRPLRSRAGAPVPKFHVLRHTHASVLLANGRSIKEVAERLGHSNPS